MDIISRKEAREQGLIRYFTGVPCKHGHMSEKLTSSATCLECIRLDSAKSRKEDWPRVHKHYKKYAKTHKETLNKIARSSYNRKDKQERTQIQFDQRQSRYTSYLLSRVKGRAKHKGIEFNITLDDIVIPTHCPILGIPLDFNKGHSRDSTPSIDRIDNKLGYIKGNIAVISMKANRLKSDASISDVRAILSYMEQHLENKV
ncbi:MAG: hypothetical protein EO766_12370 [Hydrotalea sp. AMD]|uniref:hypothetical protein n=1 Tax=Hydrotalea sp. AMD TaxID=2501297 RepID=UPI001026D550|nr:hypothetical protein [Hydrotalea sp. AMD]RWZ87313.1 MAG: hypothetical protein EO766_12370 [Hydrotalea sp. AMD]